MTHWEALLVLTLSPLLPKGQSPFAGPQCSAWAAQHNSPLGIWCNFPLDSEALARLETQVGAHWSLGNVEAETLAQYLLAHLFWLGSFPCCLSRQALLWTHGETGKLPCPRALQQGHPREVTQITWHI